MSVRAGIDTVGEALSGVGRRWVYPSALSGVDERGVAAAVNWTRIYSQWVGGTPLLRLRGDFTDCAALVGALVAGDGALTARGADPLPDWRGGLLVAVAPDRDALLACADDPRTRALCVVSRDPAQLGVWVAAAAPQLLATACAVPLPSPLSGVAVQALRTVDRLLAHPVTLASSAQRRDASAILRILHDAGEVSTAEAVCLWALRHRWTAAGATRLAGLAARSEYRSDPEALADNPFRDAIVDLWRERAARAGIEHPAAITTNIAKTMLY
ncbi:hypothetical protein ACTD5D_19475 [Nocardia takedensis]|uniref:hypothetical protein n=1 Tax=Nocardia takedensis TaxID=259390 RepID=UPI003F7630CD